MSGLISEPTLLESGPQPLTRRDSRWWAAFIVVIGAVFALLLPVIAYWVASLAVPPGAVRFGAASVIPAAGWTVSSQTEDSAVLTRAGLEATFRSVAFVGPEAVRLEQLAAFVEAEHPELTVRSEPKDFLTPTGERGLLQALAGVDTTAVIATVADDGVAADMVTIGDAKAVAASVGGIESMVTSIRILSNAGGQRGDG